jgi:hypothetical protein
MKFPLVVVLSALAAVSSEQQLRAKATTPRRTSENTVGFLASKIDENVPWCIISGEKGEELGFNPCDFEAMPSEQLWSMDDDGKLMNNGTASVLCATMSDDSDKLYMDDCSMESDKNLFSYNATSGHIQLQSNTQLCVTNRGHGADIDDSIPLLPCKDEGRFSFDFRTSDGANVEEQGQPETTTPPAEDDHASDQAPSQVQTTSGAASMIVSNSPMIATGSLLLLSFLCPL